MIRREVVDLCQKWAAIPADSAKIAVYGWDEAECAEVLGKINAFLTAGNGYGTDNSTAKRLVKGDTGQWSPVVEAVIG